MGLFDRFRDGVGVQRPASASPGDPLDDDQAIARYRYMLRTAPPETIEQAHSEAFARLTPEQRLRVLEELSNEIPAAERAAAVRAGDSPEQLARTATRAEIRQPGVMERVFGGLGAAPGSPAAGFGGAGTGGLFAGSFLSSMAGTVLGGMIAQHFFNSHPEASHLFGDASDRTHDGDLFHRAHDTKEHARDERADAARDHDLTSADLDDSLTDSGLGDDLGGFDGDTFDV